MTSFLLIPTRFSFNASAIAYGVTLLAVVSLVLLIWWARKN